MVLHPLYSVSLDLYSVCTMALGGYVKGELVPLYFSCFYEIETWLFPCLGKGEGCQMGEVKSLE